VSKFDKHYFRESNTGLCGFMDSVGDPCLCSENNVIHIQRIRLDSSTPVPKRSRKETQRTQAEEIERKRSELAELFGNRAWVSNEKAGTWGVNVHRLTEDQVRSLAKLITV
jgi:hypothetical protein